MLPQPGSGVRPVYRGIASEVEVIHRHWEILGDRAAEMRGAYDQGWTGVLELFARLS